MVPLVCARYGSSLKGSPSCTKTTVVPLYFVNDDKKQENHWHHHHRPSTHVPYLRAEMLVIPFMHYTPAVLGVLSS